MSQEHSERVKPLLPLSRTPTAAVAWLWPGRLALTKLAILEGDPGMGKSLVALDLCARVTRGGLFPDGSDVTAPGNVLILNGEDGPADTVRPRLETFGADLDRVYVRGLRGDDGEPLLYLPAKIDAFAQYLAQVQPRLVVIDPIMSFLDQSISASIDHSVRRALEPLGDLAAKQQCAMLLLRHLNKQANESPIYRGAWSMGFVACCRSAWVIAADPEHEERHVLAQVKNNLASPAWSSPSKESGRVRRGGAGSEPRSGARPTCWAGRCGGRGRATWPASFWRTSCSKGRGPASKSGSSRGPARSPSARCAAPRRNWRCGRCAPCSARGQPLTGCCRGKTCRTRRRCRCANTS